MRIGNGFLVTVARGLVAIGLSLAAIAPASAQTIINVTTGTSGTIGSGTTWNLIDGTPGGSISANTTINGTLMFSRTSDVTVTNVLGGTTTTGQLVLSSTNTSTISLTNTNSFNGLTTISGGKLSLGNGGTTGSLASGTIQIDSGKELIFNRGGTQLTHAGVIAGSGNITKAGSGVTALTGANTNTGLLTVSAGTLAVGNATTPGATGSIANSTVQIDSGGRVRREHHRLRNVRQDRERHAHLHR